MDNKLHLQLSAVISVASLTIHAVLPLRDVTELLCAADNNGRSDIRHGGHKASDSLRVNTAVLHHHCRGRLSRLLCNGRSGL